MITLDKIGLLDKVKQMIRPCEMVKVKWWEE